MKHKHSSLDLLAGCCLGLLALNRNQRQMPDTRAAVAVAIRSINPASFGAYSAGDTNCLIALYAADAVLNPSGVPSGRGMVAIREDITKDVASAKASGLIQEAISTTDAGVDGQLGW